MKLLRVFDDRVEMEFSADEISMLHYALYDYLAKVESKLKQKNLDAPQIEDHTEIKDSLEQMTEILNLLI